MAYGKVRGITKPTGDIPARIYPIENNASATRAAILTIPFDFAAGDELDPHLAKSLHNDFNDVITAGRTYPQEEPLDPASYTAYFLSHDFILGLFLTQPQRESLHDAASPIPATGLPLSPTQTSTIITIGASKSRLLLPLLPHASSSSSPPSSSPAAAAAAPTIPLPNPPSPYVFAYYIKPNYPGRSSHLCNAGFVVPRALRGRGLGRVAARSFCFYGPACGYRGSVFNLVYASNEASVRLWTRLGFRNVGRGGRLLGVSGEERRTLTCGICNIGYSDSAMLYCSLLMPPHLHNSTQQSSTHSPFHSIHANYVVYTTNVPKGR